MNNKKLLSNEIKDLNICVKGLVQGIGYRPFVACSAEETGIKGWVKNTAGIVTIRAVGDNASLKIFLQRIKKGPVGACIKEVEITENRQNTITYDDIPKSFQIIESEETKMHGLPYVPADIGICEECIKELDSRDNYRYAHAFISCTSCGPRYSIMKKLPYDRGNITMNKFGLCPICSTQYKQKNDRRRHAQTIACNNCGPRLMYEVVSAADKNQKSFIINNSDKTAVEETIHFIDEGGVCAVKDIGGYHLVCKADNFEAVSVIRNLKNRENKPLAVCFNTIEDIKKYAYVNAYEERELLSDARPIVLVRKKGNCFPDNVCRNSPYIGAMLPCNAISHLLTKALGALIMTSANESNGLMITDNQRIREWLFERSNEEYKVSILSNDREIVTPLDDSIVQIESNNDICYRQIIRRARGLVPALINIDVLKDASEKTGQCVFATGGDLKATFSYALGENVLLSQSFGDIINEDAYREYVKEEDRIKGLFGITEVSGCVTDKHPGYRVNNMYPKSQKIQHHKAHVAAVIAEKHLKGRVLGVAFDGTGYGDDGAVWGSEFFECNITDIISIERIGHLKYIKLIGGDEGAKNTEVILYGMLHSLYPEICAIDKLVYYEDFKHLNPDRAKVVSKALDMGINTVLSSSMGRLFDAVSALLNISMFNSYEGEAAIELQYYAEKTSKAYPLHIDIDKNDYCADCRGLFNDMIRALVNKADKKELARGFIRAVAEYVIDMAKLLNFDIIVLSGGTFANKVLVEYIINLVAANAMKVYINEEVPSGDGGLCLGQAYLGINAYNEP